VISLDKNNRKIIFEYFEQELYISGDLPIKEQIIKVLLQVGGNDSLHLLENVINEGESKHGRYLVQDAINAKIKILN
jgi:hypothetical protein